MPLSRKGNYPMRHRLYLRSVTSNFSLIASGFKPSAVSFVQRDAEYRMCRGGASPDRNNLYVRIPQGGDRTHIFILMSGTRWNAPAIMDCAL